MPTQNLLRLYTVTDIDAETHVSDSLSASKQKVQVEEVNQICRCLRSTARRKARYVMTSEYI